MTVLIISPDYASHLLPLATLGTAWQSAGERVVVATGDATAGIVNDFGFERTPLQLGRGSNPGVIRPEDQPAGEDDALRGFFDATRLGMIETLRYQADARSTDLLWQPVLAAENVQRVIDTVRPDHIIVDHLAYTARLALTAQRIEHADVVLGHPTALPVGSEIYGSPSTWPAAFSPDPAALAQLRRLCQRVSDNFTAQWNDALGALNPLAASSSNAFNENGALLLLNYPAALHEPSRTALLPNHTFLGSAVRHENSDAEVRAWLAASDAPYVYVSFGSFLSVRDDVLAVVVHALRELGVRAAIALGSANRAVLGELPEHWLVREFLPQVTLLQTAAAAVTHGGNNSVTEAMTFGVALVVLPFSTDQFAGAAALEREGFGVVLAPNTLTVEPLKEALRTVLEPSTGLRARLDDLASSLQTIDGRSRAFWSVFDLQAT